MTAAAVVNMERDKTTVSAMSEGIMSMTAKMTAAAIK